MQYAKKLALVDPKILDQLQVDMEYKAIQKRAPAVAKTRRANKPVICAHQSW